MNQKSARETPEEISESISSNCGHKPEGMCAECCLQIKDTEILELKDQIQAERQRCEGLRQQVEDIKTQAGYEIEQARHHLEVAEKMGMEKRFGFVASVSGFERLKGQLESALSPTSAVEAEEEFVCPCELHNDCDSECDPRECHKPMTQEPNPKHIIFKGRVYGLLEEGCYTMKNPVQVVEKTQEPSLLWSKDKALENVRLLAAREFHKTKAEPWGHILRFCKNAGFEGSILRDAKEPTHE